MASHYGRVDDLIQLEIRSDAPPSKLGTAHRFNLTGNRDIPFSTYAKFVVDTATSLGQGGDKGFFKSQAQTHIAHALELLFESRQPVTLAGAFELLSNRDKLEQELGMLRELHPYQRRAAVVEHFANRFLT